MILDNTWKNKNIDGEIVGIIDTVADNKITNPLNQIDIKDIKNFYIISQEESEWLNIYKKIGWPIDSNENNCFYDPRNQTVYLITDNEIQFGDINNLFKDFINTVKIIGLERCTFSENTPDFTDVFLNCNSLEELSLPTPKNEKTLNDQISNLKNLKRLSAIYSENLKNHNLYFYFPTEKKWRKIEDMIDLFADAGKNRQTFIHSDYIDKNTYISREYMAQLTKLVREKDKTNIWYNKKRLLKSFYSYTLPVLAEGELWFSNSGKTDKNVYTEIEILDEIGDIDVSKTIPWSGGDNVMVYAVDKKLYIVGNGSGKIQLSPNSEGVFMGFENVTTIKGLRYLDTSNVTTFKESFKYCYNLRGTIDISTWDISNVSSISEMFYRCENVETIIMPKGNYPKILDGTSAMAVFKGCYSLKLVNLGATSENEGIEHLGKQCFIGCPKVNRIKGTQNVKDVGDEAFMSCFELKTIDPMKNLLTVGSHSFAFTPKLKESGIDSSKITSLGSSAFRSSSIETSTDFSNLSDDIVGKYATRLARWGDNLSQAQKITETFTKSINNLNVKKSESQSSYPKLGFAGTNIAAAGCGPVSLFHCWQILYLKDEKDENLDFEKWYQDKMGGPERMNKYNFETGAYNGEMTYYIVNDFVNGEINGSKEHNFPKENTLGLKMSEKFSPLETGRIQQALESGHPLLCIVPVGSSASTGKHMVTINGYNKDTDEITIIDSEWPWVGKEDEQFQARHFSIHLEDFLYYISSNDYSKIYEVQIDPNSIKES